MKNIILPFILLALISCNPEATFREMDATRWLGPLGNGIYPDTKLLKQWPEEGPEILWTYDSLGIGYSSGVVHNGYLYTTGMIDSTGYLYKLDMNGELVFQIPYGPEWNGSYRGTRGSTTIAGDKIYLVSGMGKLICFSKENGTILWSKEYFSDFDGKNIMWGINETPVVDGDVVYATPGGKDYNVVALDRHSGELIWKCKGKGDVSAYCTPLLFDHNERKILITCTAAYLLGIDALSGQLLWSHDISSEWSVHSTTPLYHEGAVFYPSGLNKGGGKLKLSEEGDSVSVQWENNASDFRYTAIIVDGRLYESFSDDKRLTWRCADWKTGAEISVTTDLQFGRGIYADGMLYVYNISGELALVKPDPEGFSVISMAKVSLGSGMHQAQPVIFRGVLYVRHGNAMIAYNIKG